MKNMNRSGLAPLLVPRAITLIATTSYTAPRVEKSEDNPTSQEISTNKRNRCLLHK